MAVVDPRGRGSGGTEVGATTGKKIDENKAPRRTLLLMRAPRNCSRSYRVRRWGVGTTEEKFIRNLLLRQAEEKAYEVGGGKDAAIGIEGESPSRKERRRKLQQLAEPRWGDRK